MTNRRKVSESVIDTKITLQLASNKTYFVAVVAKNSHGFTSKAASVVIETPSGKKVFSNLCLFRLLLLCFDVIDAMQSSSFILSFFISLKYYHHYYYNYYKYCYFLLLLSLLLLLL